MHCKLLGSQLTLPTNNYYQTQLLCRLYLYIAAFFLYSIYSIYYRPLFHTLLSWYFCPPLSPNTSDQSGDSIDPFDIYTEEEFLANQNILDSFGPRIEAKIKAKMEVGPSRHQSGSRKYINRNREGAHAQLMADYFDENPLYSDTMFCRRFRMRRHIFLRIVNALCVWSSYFTQRVDCTGRLGLSPLQSSHLYACIWDCS